VGKTSISPRLTDEPLKNIGNNDEEVGGEGITLPQPVAAEDPVSRDSVKEHGSVPSVQDVGHPGAPPIIKPPSLKDTEEAVPVDRVESFSEINFEDDRGGFAEVAAPQDVGRVKGCAIKLQQRHRRAWPLDHVYNSLEYMNMINIEVFNFNLMLVLIMSIPQKMSVL
jgi:hypothetical protein